MILSCAHAQRHFHINGAASAQIGCRGGGCSVGFAWLDNRLAGSRVEKAQSV